MNGRLVQINIKPDVEGDLGENLTVKGLDYDDFFPGRRLRVGEEVEIEVSRACKPCHHLAKLAYVGEEKKKAFIQTMLDRRGWYARVRRGGTIRVSDPVVLLDQPEKDR